MNKEVSTKGLRALQPSTEVLAKIALVGAPKVGKSSIALQYLQKSFSEEYEPTLEDTYQKTLNMEKNTWNLTISDTAGLTNTFLKDNDILLQDGYLLVYSVSDRDGYELIREQITKILQTGAKFRNIDRFPLVLVANKTDVDANDRLVSTAEALEFSKTIGIEYSEVSAKYRVGIDEIFLNLIKKVSIAKAEVLKSEKRKTLKSRRSDEGFDMQTIVRSPSEEKRFTRGKSVEVYRKGDKCIIA